MRGKVLTYDAQSSEGLISGDDGLRYSFKGTDVAAEFNRVKAGAEVDFETSENAAIAIVPLVNTNSGIGDGEKTKIVAALLAFFLGGLGIHKFYLGKNTAGAIMLVGSVLGVIFLFIPTIIVGFVAFIEGVIYLLKSDQDFEDLYVKGDKAWF